MTAHHSARQRSQRGRVI